MTIFGIKSWNDINTFIDNLNLEGTFGITFLNPLTMRKNSTLTTTATIIDGAITLESNYTTIADVVF